MCYKMEFDSYTEAEKEKRKINWFLRLKKQKRLTNIYRCKRCGKFHLTSEASNKIKYTEIKEIII